MSEALAKNCTKGQSCGNSCISWDKVCHIGTTPTPTTMPPSQPPSNSPPIASFAISATSGSTPLTVTLDASSSYDPDGNIVTYAWQTSDKQGIEGKEVRVTFVNAGTYTITLTVTDNNGERASYDQIVTVKTATTTPSTPYTNSPFIDYQWKISPDTCLLEHADETMTATGFNLSGSTGKHEVVGTKGNYKGVIACIGRRSEIVVFTVAGPNYEQARKLAMQMKEIF